MFLSCCTKVAYWPQWWTAFTLSLAVAVTGLSKGWTSPYMAQLTAPDNAYSLKLTTSEASWVASFLNLGAFVGVIVGIITQEFIGRKKTLVFSGVPLAASWICIIIANSVTWLYAARIFAGLGAGMIGVALPLFLGEIADPVIRGSLVFLNTNASTVGNFLGNTMGPYLTMEIFSYVSLAITLLFIVLFSLVPESPYHHIVNGDLSKAEKSLLWYKRNADAKREVLELQDLVGKTSVGFARRFQVLKKSIHRKNLIVICFLTVFLHCAGGGLISFYAEIILTKSETQLKPSSVVIALGFSAILAGATSIIFIDKFGRRSLLIGTGLGVVAAHILLGSHFHMLSLGFEPSSIGWLPVFALFLEYISLGWGLASVPYVLLGELFPPILKTIASFSYNSSSALMSFVTVKGYQPFLDLVGEKYVFWTFSASAMCSVVFTYFLVPETKGKSLAKIQENFNKGANNYGVIDKSIRSDETKIRTIV